MADITVKVCDRCGKPIDYHTIPWLIIPYQSGDDFNYDFNKMTRTLCEECQSSLTDWLLLLNDEDKGNLQACIIEKQKIEESVTKEEPVHTDDENIFRADDKNVIPILRIGPWSIDKSGWYFQGSGKDECEKIHKEENENA